MKKVEELIDAVSLHFSAPFCRFMRNESYNGEIFRSGWPRNKRDLELYIRMGEIT